VLSEKKILNETKNHNPPCKFISFFKNSITLACFQSTGILPLSIESWKKNDKNGDSSSDKLFKK
jgi:hypothetical protein